MQRKESLKSRLLLSEEGSVFVLGSVMLILWLCAVVVLWRIESPRWGQVLTMGFTELIVGRAAAIAQATQFEMHPVLIVLLATYVDALTVFIAYPVLILSYRSLVERRLLEAPMRKIFDSAQRNVTRFAKYKIAGVFIFVWFPFFMTGVVVGAVLGYLLGLKTWLNMVTVTVSTMIAAICWAYAYDNAFEWLGRIHKGIPLVLTVLIIIACAVWRVVQDRRATARKSP